MPHARAMKSVNAEHFAMIPRNDVPRSAFSVRHTHKTTFNADYLIPVYVDEVIPGDSIRVKMTAICRLAPALVPPMDNLILESFFFFVPYRLVWTNFRRFMGEQNNPSDTTVFLVPQMVGIDETFAIAGTLYDYMGITVNGDAAATLNVSALPIRAYALIWNEWFRDQDLQNFTVCDVDDGPDAPGDYGLLVRCKRPDYFTSARPWPQKPMNIQDLSTLEPTRLGGRMLSPTAGAPVSGLGVLASASPTAAGQTLRYSGSRQETVASNWNSVDDTFYMKVDSGVAPDVRVLINDIRTANMVQLLLERNARGGSRYTEIIRSHFGVVSPDARLQRPEYLGGGRSFVNFAPISQTSASATPTAEFDVEETKLGEQAGQGTVAVHDHGFSGSFTEHGVIIGMVNIRSDITYQNGVERFWFRRTQFDFPWPALMHLGEQAITMRELYCTGNSGADTVIFGYQERWAEYRTKPNRISGYFRSVDPTPLDMWHFAQNIGSTPALNDAFVQSGVPTGRVLQNGSWAGQDFLFDSLFDIRYVRPMPMFSIPGMGPGL